MSLFLMFSVTPPLPQPLTKEVQIQNGNQDAASSGGWRGMLKTSSAPKPDDGFAEEKPKQLAAGSPHRGPSVNFLDVVSSKSVLNYSLFPLDSSKYNINQFSSFPIQWLQHVFHCQSMVAFPY